MQVEEQVVLANALNKAAAEYNVPVKAAAQAAMVLTVKCYQFYLVILAPLNASYFEVI